MQLDQQTLDFVARCQDRNVDEKSLIEEACWIIHGWWPGQINAQFPIAMRIGELLSVTAFESAAMLLVPNGYLITVDSWDGSMWAVGIWKGRSFAVYPERDKNCPSLGRAMASASVRANAILQGKKNV